MSPSSGGKACVLQPGPCAAGISLDIRLATGVPGQAWFGVVWVLVLGFYGLGFRVGFRVEGLGVGAVRLFGFWVQVRFWVEGLGGCLCLANPSMVSGFRV